MPNIGAYGMTGAETVAYQPGVDTMDAHRRYHEFQMRQIHGPDWQPEPLADGEDPLKQYNQQYLDSLGSQEEEEKKGKGKGKGGFMKKAVKGLGKVLNGGAGRAYGKGEEGEVSVR